MIRIMVVEDKRITREGLVRIPDWGSLNAAVVKACESAEQALEYLKGHPVEIVITDIRMDGMDGIEFSRHLRRQYPSVKIIIVSAYQDFEYARTALEIGISSYVLKPVDENELLAKVADAIADLKGELSVSSRLDELVRAKAAEVLLDYISGISASGDALCANLRQLGVLPEELQCVVITVKSFGVSLSAKDILAGFETMYAQKLCFTFDNLAVGVVFCSLQEFRKNSVRNTSIVHHSANGFIRICISDTANGIEELKPAFQMAIGMQQYAFLYNLGRIVYADEVPADFLNSLKSPSEYAPHFDNEEIARCFLQQNPQALKEHINNMFLMFQERFCRSSHIVQQCAQLGFYLEESRERLGLFGQEIAFSALYQARNLAKFHNLSLLHEYVLETLLEGYNLAAVYRGGQKRPIVNRAIEYATEHIDKVDLNLMQVANALKVSYVYLSKAFKEDCGESYTQYINKCRIEQAKIYLREQNIKGSDVCKMVGLEPKNFYRLFKRLVNMTPGEYQKFSGKN